MGKKKRLVVLSGAGISAESGLKTFRDANGLWEGHDVTQVASPQGWMANPSLVLEFYNQRRKQALSVQPNNAHLQLAALEAHFDVQIITQNVDHLHEMAGSSKVLHLHGKLFESRSTANENLIYDIDGWALNLGDTCELGSQLRPNIVWFGEAVPAMTEAMALTNMADHFLVIGTSLQVYPAAGLLDYAPTDCPIYLIDPMTVSYHGHQNIHVIKDKATTGIEQFIELLM
jgi:NAD-dependent deacetylase